MYHELIRWLNSLGSNATDCSCPKQQYIGGSVRMRSAEMQERCAKMPAENRTGANDFVENYIAYRCCGRTRGPNTVQIILIAVAVCGPLSSCMSYSAQQGLLELTEVPTDRDNGRYR